VILPSPDAFALLYCGRIAPRTDGTRRRHSQARTVQAVRGLRDRACAAVRAAIVGVGIPGPGRYESRQRSACVPASRPRAGAAHQAPGVRGWPDASRRPAQDRGRSADGSRGRRRRAPEGTPGPQREGASHRGKARTSSDHANVVICPAGVDRPARVDRLARGDQPARISVAACGAGRLTS